MRAKVKWVSFWVVAVLAGISAPAEDRTNRDAAPSGDPALVRIDSGALRGAEASGASAFLGIPYAAPPVGLLRYSPPAPVAPWQGERPANDYAPPCPQFPADLVNGAPGYRGDEDCLYLNVWTPSDRAENERLPVLVFLHGGGNFSGSNSDPLDYLLRVTDGGPAYDGARLAARGRVVVVAPNYRLGALGFLAHTVARIDGTGNFGILDQREALEWVRRNIAAFGGDPQRVLLYGQSGGAYDVCIHMASPSSKGLFQSAIMMSGVCYAHPFATMEYQTREFLEEMNCSGADDVLGCLRRLDPRTMVTASSALPSGLASFGLHPYVDGQVIPVFPSRQLETGAHNHIPFVIGSTANEYAHRFDTVTDANYRFALAQILGQPVDSPAMDRVLDLYGRDSYATARDLVTDVVTDRNLTCPVRSIARSAAGSQSEPVYRYHFSKILSSPQRFANGAYHASDLLFLFQHMTGEEFLADDQDRAVQDHMLGYWTRFAAHGNPNGSGATYWPEFSAATGEEYLILNPETGVDRDLKREACDFWSGVAPVINPGGIVNAASFASGAPPDGGLARGSYFTVYGTDLGPDPAASAAGYPLPATLDGVSISVLAAGGSHAAWPVFVSRSQINAILPSEVPLGDARVVVSYQGRQSAAAPVRVVKTSLGFFSQRVDQKNLAISQNYVSPSSAPLNEPETPARPGQIVILWGTGLGPVPGADNVAPSAVDMTEVPVEIRIGGIPAERLYAGRQPESAAVDNVYFRVPENAPTGCEVPVAVVAGGVPANTVYIAVTRDGLSCKNAAPPTQTTLLTPEGEAWYDPEVLSLNGEAFITWQDRTGGVWLANLAPDTGRALTPRQIGEGAAPLLQTFNGPEFGVDQTGLSVHFTRLTPLGSLESVQVRNPTATPAVTVLPGEGLFTPLATKWSEAPSTRLIAVRRGAMGWGTALWLDLAAPAIQHDLFPLLQRTAGDARWVNGTLSLVTNAHPAFPGALSLVDTTSGQVSLIARADGRMELPYGWLGPDGALHALSVIDGTRLGVWRQTETGWTPLLVLTSPEAGGGFPHIGSPEPFVTGGRSYLSLVVSQNGDLVPGQSEQHVWILSLDPSAPFSVRCDDGDPEGLTRADPEVLVSGDRLFVYYYTLDPVSSRLRVCETPAP